MDDLQAMILEYINAYRKNDDLNSLINDERLNDAAEIRAREASELFEHKRLDGSDVKTVLNDLSPAWFGENLAIAEEVNPENIVKAWMNSLAHRANNLNRHYAKAGINYFQGEDNKFYIAMLFTSDDI